jgi:primosomal protein N' (replication factor Y)
MQDNNALVRVALPVPLSRVFDYVMPSGWQPTVGARVRVPFGKRKLIGMVTAVGGDSDIDDKRLKKVAEIIDQRAVIDPAQLSLLHWIAEYYHHPPGEVIFTFLPAALRQGKPATPPLQRRWQILDAGQTRLAEGAGRARLQHRLLETIAAQASGATDEQLLALSPGWRRAAKALLQEGCITETRVNHEPARQSAAQLSSNAEIPLPNPQQQAAIDAVSSDIGRFRCYLLHGITGSGKTEVYLRIIEQVLARDQQVLVLVPEISLTPQLVDRFSQRFDGGIEVMHSALNDTQRLQAWQRARDGSAAIVIGTRSAVLTPLSRLGLIIIDEEHDASFKQQDGLRYHARDVAIKRASSESIPVLLGSATPALESWHNAQQGRYRHLSLDERANRAALPVIHLLDLQHLPLDNGISMPLRDAIRRCHERGEQSLLFLNRRGYAPAVCCGACHELIHCHRCDARMTWHQHTQRLLCHHCGHEQRWPERCPQCRGEQMDTIGQGTENIEMLIGKILPAARVERIDRDTTRKRGELESRLSRIHSGEADVLVGTQMLSKGHDFPNVTLVGILDSDQLLFSSDFRASERLFQLLTQVAGRAGRADKPGTVLVQTRYPDSPWLQAVVAHDYQAFARLALQERRQAEYPPYSHLALLRAEAPSRGEALAFLAAMHGLARRVIDTDKTALQQLELMEPIPAVMEKRAGRFRAQLLVQSKRRSTLHRFLRIWRAEIEDSRRSRRVRWSLDVDPADLY